MWEYGKLRGKEGVAEENTDIYLGNRYDIAETEALKSIYVLFLPMDAYMVVIIVKNVCYYQCQTRRMPSYISIEKTHSEKSSNTAISLYKHMKKYPFPSNLTYSKS